MIPAVEELIKQAQQGDLPAFEKLVLLYQDRIFTHCYHLKGDEHEAKDLAQQVFVQAFNKIKSFRFNMDFAIWLHRLAVNLYSSQHRRNKKGRGSVLFKQEGPGLQELAAVQEQSGEQMEGNEFNYWLHSTLKKMPYDYRMALILRELERYSYEEISIIMGWSLGTVKSRLNRGRKALRKALQLGHGTDN
ncbi:MAG: sigma-70 family RNA polymerase sigma factor [Syntrophomonadaceae bacterium]|nr:sigma-70 family RNA polymerase sigma factor [Syntrophomonadaceae bacterium]